MHWGRKCCRQGLLRFVTGCRSRGCSRRSVRLSRAPASRSRIDPAANLHSQIFGLAARGRLCSSRPGGRGPAMTAAAAPRSMAGRAPSGAGGCGTGAAPTILHQHPREPVWSPLRGQHLCHERRGVLQAPSMATDRRHHPAQGAEPSCRARLKLGHTATGGHRLVPEGVRLGRGMGRSGIGGAEALLGQLPATGTTQLLWAQLHSRAPEPFPCVCLDPQPSQGAQPPAQARAPHTRLSRPCQRRGQLTMPRDPLAPSAPLNSLAAGERQPGGSEAPNAITARSRSLLPPPAPFIARAGGREAELALISAEKSRSGPDLWLAARDSSGAGQSRSI